MLLLLQAIVEDRSDFDLRGYSEATVRQAIDAGLGAALYRITRHGLKGAWHDVLRAQELAARVESLGRLDALEEILAAGPRELSEQVLLLKGISLCQRIYPEPHLRMMGDIDLLVPSASQGALENILSGLGYVQRSRQEPEFYVRHHHSMPFMHARTGVVVEVHTGLFPPDSRLGSVELFRPGSFWPRRVTGEFRGFRIHRLDGETELAYLASHWINERRFFGTAVIPMLDLALLIRNQPAGFDWNRMFRAVAGTPAAASVRVALGFIHDRVGVRLPAAVRRQLAGLNSRPQAVVDPLLRWMLDRYAVRAAAFGRLWTRNMANSVWDALLAPRPGWRNILSLPWHLVFPYGHPRRYDLRFQVRRLLSPMRRDGKSRSRMD